MTKTMLFKSKYVSLATVSHASEYAELYFQTWIIITKEDFLRKLAQNLDILILKNLYFSHTFADFHHTAKNFKYTFFKIHTFA
jgi:hypothetical protein